MSVDDLFYIPTELFGVGLIILFSLIVINKFSTSFVSIAGAGSSAANFSSIGTTIFNSIAGYFFLAIFIGLIILSLILAMQLPTSIVWTPLFAIVTFVAVWIAAPISTAYDMLIGTAAFNTYAVNVQVMTLIMGNLPYIMFVLGGILAIVTFVKFRNEQRIEEIRPI